ncbi:MBL fold metallo-hydrolase [Arenibacter latericius]|uniref:MBL fold metallo-hydrolase n=1 Tax=Arenibacter latericius TaxID=86104 RepID=UPI00040DC6DB|nr:MBL fold metallo-hydrolase [Arenibacter latericius]MDX1362642.1 MBL fold metallo-hydrolase [Arenibacter latericius]
MKTYHLFRLILVIITVLVLSCKEKSKSAAPINEIVPQKENKAVDIQISPIEHASAVLIMDDVTIYIDPVGEIDSYDDVPEPDLILITDIHGDHFSLETLEALNTQNSKIILPQAVAEKMPEKYTPQLDILDNGDHKVRFGITIEAIPMYNLREEAKDFHPKGRGNGYVISKNEERIYFSGDTEDIPEMRALSQIDKAFICMNLPYTMDIESAAEAVLEFRPKQVYPYHYRGNPDVSDVSLFKKIINSENPDIEVVQLDWYPNMDY